MNMAVCMLEHEDVGKLQSQPQEAALGVCQHLHHQQE